MINSAFAASAGTVTFLRDKGPQACRGETFFERLIGPFVSWFKSPGEMGGGATLASGITYSLQQILCDTLQNLSAAVEKELSCCLLVACS